MFKLLFSYLFAAKTWVFHGHFMLVGGLEHFLFFHSVGNFIIPTDELIFFRGLGIPPTSMSFPNV